MSGDMQAILNDLVGRVAGSRGAILLDKDGVPIAQAPQGPAFDLEAVGALSRPLLQDAMGAAQRRGHGAVLEVLLEAERATLAMIPLKNSCYLCFLLSPEAALGRGLFEARRAASALNQTL
jgi:predicted regulator of Ras-like GTPase activity (Roadblock/LC7/MglB family)